MFTALIQVSKVYRNNRVLNTYPYLQLQKKTKSFIVLLKFPEGVNAKLIKIIHTNMYL